MSDKAPCEFCGVESDYSSFFGSIPIDVYRCPQCGCYVLDDTLSKLKDKRDDAFKIACLVREKQLAGKEVQYGVLGDDFQPSEQNIAKHLNMRWRIGELLAEFPKPNEIIDRALLNLSRFAVHPMGTIAPKNEDLPFILFCPNVYLDYQWRFMQEMDLIKNTGGLSVPRRCTITPHGWDRIQELSKITRESKQAFVAMWFDPKMDKVFTEGIKPAFEGTGFECKRIDAVEHNNKICDEIVAEIRKSRFVVADFTGQRGGVYYEAGYAMGMGLPVIWLVQKDDVDKLHFDTRQYSHIVYESNEELKQKLHNRIAATIH